MKAIEDGVLQGTLEGVTSISAASAEQSKEDAPSRASARSKRKLRLTQHQENVKAANEKGEREDYDEQYKKALKEGTELVQKGRSVRKVATDMNEKYHLGGGKEKNQ